MEQLVNFPELDPPHIVDTGEGGLAVFFALLEMERLEDRRQVCLAGGPEWGVQDVVLSPGRMQVLNKEMSDIASRSEYTLRPSHEMDLVMLVASTKQSIWIEKDGHYFKPTKKDLTDRGLMFYIMLTEIYAEEPMIVTLLDT